MYILSNPIIFMYFFMYMSMLLSAVSVFFKKG